MAPRAPRAPDFDPFRSGNPFVNGSQAYRFVEGLPALCIRCGMICHFWTDECLGPYLDAAETEYLRGLVTNEHARVWEERRRNEEANRPAKRPMSEGVPMADARQANLPAPEAPQEDVPMSDARQDRQQQEHPQSEWVGYPGRDIPREFSDPLGPFEESDPAHPDDRPWDDPYTQHRPEDWHRDALHSQHGPDRDRYDRRPLDWNRYWHENDLDSQYRSGSDRYDLHIRRRPQDWHWDDPYSHHHRPRDWHREDSSQPGEWHREDTPSDYHPYEWYRGDPSSQPRPADEFWDRRTRSEYRRVDWHEWDSSSQYRPRDWHRDNSDSQRQPAPPPIELSHRTSPLNESSSGMSFGSSSAADEMVEQAPAGAS